jgi:hypothetical protein
MSKKENNKSRRDFLKYLGLGSITLAFANMFGVLGFLTSSKSQTNQKPNGFGSGGYGM